MQPPEPAPYDVTEERISELAADLRFALLAVTDAQPAAHGDVLRQWIADGRHGDMAYMAEDLDVRLDVRKLLPGAKSILCVADAYRQVSTPPPPPMPSGKVARYAWGDDYHAILKDRLHELADRLRPLYLGHKFLTTVDTAPILEREHAARAGLGWIGKHTLLIHPQHGSWFLLGCIVTTLAIEPRRDRKPVTDHCGNCTRCIDACPTQCIEPYRVDASRCVSYLTIEHRGLIDPALHDGMGDWVAGCDVCQDVCPYNRIADKTGETPPPVLPQYAPRPPGPATPLTELLRWNAATRQAVLKRSALKRIKLNMWIRNALIAAGNSLARQDDPMLREQVAQLAQQTEDVMVRRTARDVRDRLTPIRNEPETS
ncbi:MAG: tRNA epoxyqueuosine(34) reductase QueG [Phycisphaeraceae bacterium]|nr:tRNA epoxyqueuosine(34) reductase QueG [Phycisphaeraceae bacterium]